MPCVSELATMMSETAPVFTFGVMDQRFIFADELLRARPAVFQASRTFLRRRAPFSELGFRLHPIVHLIPKPAIPSAIDFVRVVSNFVLCGLPLLSNGRLLVGLFLHHLV